MCETFYEKVRTVQEKMNNPKYGKQEESCMKKFMALILCLVCALPIVGCAPKIKDTESNIIVEMYEGGYGTAGMQAVADRFEEIYEEEGLTVTIQSSAQLVMNGAYQQLQLGKDSPTDLFFVASVDVPYIIGEGENFIKNTDNEYALEDLTDLYGQKVYGEDITFGKKMNPSNNAFNLQENGRYYSMNWAYGVTGFAYRRENFGEGKWQLPRTTNELKGLIPKIKDNGQYPFIFCGSKASYFDYPALTWWRQMATDEEAVNFWNCQVEDEEGNLIESPEAFRSYSRLVAYNNVDMCIYDTTNSHPDSMTVNNEQAQTILFDDDNKVVFMPAGDWTENEMKKLGITGDIGLMRTPVSSEVLKYATGTVPNVQLHDRFKTIKDEETLRNVISVIDAGDPCPEGIDADDFKLLTKIRSYSTSEGLSHIGYIPSHANAKEAAKKFLLFLASDEAIQIYYDTTGCFLPFDSSNLQIAEDATPFQHDLLNMMENVNFVSRFDSKNPIFYMTDLEFNMNEYFMDGKIGTTATGDKVTGTKYFEMNADDVEENFPLYQGIVSAAGKKS